MSNSEVWFSDFLSAQLIISKRNFNDMKKNVGLVICLLTSQYMKSSAENKLLLFWLNTSRIFKFYYLSFLLEIVKFKNLATFQKYPSLCVCNNLRYFLYTLLASVFIRKVLSVFHIPHQLQNVRFFSRFSLIAFEKSLQAFFSSLSSK